MSNDDLLPVEQEWVSITADVEDFNDAETSIDIQDPSSSSSSFLQRQREEPTPDCQWNDAAISQAFRTAVASHDYDRTAEAVVVHDEHHIEELDKAKLSSLSSSTATAAAAADQKRNGTTKASLSSSWIPRPLPIPTWAIDVFLTDDDVKVPSASTVKKNNSSNG